MAPSSKIDYAALPPWAWPDSVSEKKYIYSDDVPKKYYKQFQINAWLSFFPDSVLFANEMNRLLPKSNRWHYDFYFYGLTKKTRKRFNKFKREKEAYLYDIAQYLELSLDKTREVLELLTEQQFEKLKTTLLKGGLK